MKEKLYEICERVLESEEETKRFLDLKTMDDLYSYFSKQIPELTKEELDSFVADVLEKYDDSHFNYEEVDKSLLHSISGGLGSGRKLTSGILALISSFSFITPNTVASANGVKYDNASFSVSKDSDNGKTAIANVYHKTKKWIKRHKLLVGAGLGALTLTAVGVYYMSRNRDDSTSAEKIYHGMSKKSEVPVEPKRMLEYKKMIEYTENIIRGSEKNPDYSKALVFSAKFGLDDYVIKLLNIVGNKPSVVNCRDLGGGYTALMYAVQYCTPETVEVLLRHGADVSMSSLANPSSMHVWELAVVRADYHYYDHLREVLLPYDANYPQERREEDFIRIHKLLLQYGFHFSRIEGANTAHVCAQYGEKLCEELVDAGYYDIEYSKLLIRAGADLTQTDKNGRTPLVIAAEEGYADIITLLLENSNGQITEEDKENAKKAAEAKNHPEIVKLIK